MHVSLTPELEARVKAKVDSGLYNNASEVIREALRFMDTHDDWVKELKVATLRKQLQVGVDQLSQGNYETLHDADDINRLFAKIAMK